MKLLYPNKTLVESKKTFIYKVNGKDYLFYTSGDPVGGMETVCFGELKDGSLFAVAAEDLEKFKVFLGALANNKVGAEYVLQPDTNQEVTIYGGAKSQIASNIVDAIVVPVGVTPVQPVVTPVTPVQPPMPASPVQPTVAQPTPVTQAAPAPQATQEAPKPKKKGIPGVVLAAIILLIIVGGYVFYTYYLTGVMNKNATSTTSTSTTTSVSESTTVAVKTVGLSCTKDGVVTDATYTKTMNIDITFSADAGEPTTIIETTKYVFANATDMQTFATTDKATDRSADTALGISYTNYSDATSFTYTTMKTILKTAVADTTWTTYTQNYKTPEAARTYLELQSYTCTLSD